MLPRPQRLNARKDWDALFAGGFSVSGRLVSLRVRSSHGPRRVGVSVGKKVGNAVVRNRVKRRLREIARAHWEEMPEGDIAILARPDAARADFSTLEAAVLEAAGRAAGRIAQSAHRKSPAPAGRMP